MDNELIMANIDDFISYFDLIESQLRKEDSDNFVTIFKSKENNKNCFANLSLKNSKTSFSLYNCDEETHFQMMFEYDDIEKVSRYRCTYYSYVPTKDDEYPIPSLVVLGKGNDERMSLVFYGPQELTSLYEEHGLAYLSYAPPLFFQKMLDEEQIAPSKSKEISLNDLSTEIKTSLVPTKKINSV